MYAAGAAGAGGIPARRPGAPRPSRFTRTLLRVAEFMTRLAPPIAWVGLHVYALRRGNNNNNAQRTAKSIRWEWVQRHGFVFKNWRDHPLRLLTFSFVHHSTEHLLANVGGYLCALIAFAPEPALSTTQAGGGSAGRTGSQGTTGSSVLIFPAHLSLIADWLLSGGRASVDRSVLQVAKECALLYALLLGGGVCGALPAMYLYAHHKTVKVKRHYGFGMQLVESAVARIHKYWVTDRIVILGGSAGVCALVGFNSVVSPRIVGTLLFVLPEVFALASDLQQTPRLLPSIQYDTTRYSPAASNGAPAPSSPFAESAQNGTSGEGLQAQVGHAGHLGGFAFGVLVGLGWKTWKNYCRMVAGGAGTGPRLSGTAHYLTTSGLTP